MNLFILHIAYSVSYAKINSRDCKSHGYRIITNIEECEAAASEFGLQDQSAMESQEEGRSHGCTYGRMIKVLIFASPMGHPYSNVPCGSWSHENRYDCICAIAGDMNLILASIVLI